MSNGALTTSILHDANTKTYIIETAIAIINAYNAKSKDDDKNDLGKK
jgi:hypothetical protein